MFYFSDSAYLSKTEFYPKTPFNGCTNESCFNGGICQNVSKNESICSCPVHYTGISTYMYIQSYIDL